MQSPSDDRDRTRFTLDTAEYVESSGSQQAQKIGRVFEADCAFLWYRLARISQSRQGLSSAKKILFVTCFKSDIFHTVLLSAAQSVWN